MSDGEASMEKKINSRQQQRSKLSQRSAATSSPQSQVVSSASVSSSGQQADLKLKAGDSLNRASVGKNGRQDRRNKPFPVAQRKASGPGPLAQKRPFPRNSSGPNGFRNQVGNGDLVGGELGGSGAVFRNGGFNRELQDSRSNRMWDQRFARQRYTSNSMDFNKERFLQANCQFIVSEAFDYSSSLVDPDLLVEWEQIEEMRLISEEIPSCPICLYPPVAAKITRCGHIYCWSCILHYLALSDKQWRKCPICYESVYRKQVKSVVAMAVEKVAVDGILKMRLMQREKGSTIALPFGEWKDRHSQLMRFGDDCSRYGKLLKISHNSVRETIIERERVELKSQLEEQRNEPEAVFVLQALSLLDEREEEVKLAGTMRQIVSSPVLARTSSPTPENMIDQFTAEGVTFFADAFEDIKSEEKWMEKEPEHAEHVASTVDDSQSVAVSVAEHKQSQQEHSKRMIYFYQADDGQQIYVNPINVRCLVQEYGSLEQAPLVISGKIVSLETFVMTEDLRQRFRYLAHLPLSTCFTLAELKLDAGILSKETKSHFSEEFSRRNQARLKKERVEKRRAVRAEQWGKACLMDPVNYVMSKFPSCPVPDIPVVTYVASAEQDIKASLEQSPPVQSRDGDSPPGESCSPKSDIVEQSPPSFAQMLKLGKPKPSVLPSGGEREEIVVGASAGGGSEGSDSDECLPAPSYQNTIGDALQAAFDNLKTGEDEEKRKKERKEGKKGKKQKGKLLFAV